MITLILTLMIAAIVLQVFCFTRLSSEGPRAIARKQVTKVAEKIEEKKTSLGRPVRIIHVGSGT